MFPDAVALYREETAVTPDEPSMLREEDAALREAREMVAYSLPLSRICYHFIVASGKKLTILIDKSGLNDIKKANLSWNRIIFARQVKNGTMLACL